MGQVHLLLLRFFHFFFKTGNFKLPGIHNTFDMSKIDEDGVDYYWSYSSRMKKTIIEKNIVVLPLY
jgi:hypothetical protein